ncbi:hypothetical protein ABFS82_05G028200 [Erythranthe guttata]|uniref:Protein MIZU-KUSSEI 1 n=1 Tax=Erythranthe guttata TaxID=4155 RepID=A0A022Q3S0_ERYGU|nr:PREDICTED: protein MIZU-KUSSEI 1 [Erythranthe guttata]EYU22616.1 hypothetical protein MIMGU_mgv1a011113mg [Erythranthe guttata]|eukprot:XP_012855203.1 PREDICTED: protein MIZU-KUSSEI 1 [Erythranthe guttata]
MRPITARNSHDSFSFSRRYFTWKKKSVGEYEEEEELDEDDVAPEIIMTSNSGEIKNFPLRRSLSKASEMRPPRRKLSVISVTSVSSKLRSAISLVKGGAATAAAHFPSSRRLGTKVVGTLFGQRRGHVRFAFQEDFKSNPAFLVELATPTSVLVKEMASGHVRIALECDKRIDDKKTPTTKTATKRKKKRAVKILEEPFWSAYCNGKKCGYAVRRECGPDEWKVLNAVGPITMGAGVLPAPPGAADSDGEIMYMRAKFERVVGCNDSQAFYMINPDDVSGGCPELSIYLLRV